MDTQTQFQDGQETTPLIEKVVVETKQVESTYTLTDLVKQYKDFDSAIAGEQKIIDDTTVIKDNYTSQQQDAYTSLAEKCTTLNVDINQVIADYESAQNNE